MSGQMIRRQLRTLLQKVHDVMRSRHVSVGSMHCVHQLPSQINRWRREHEKQQQEKYRWYSYCKQATRISVFNIISVAWERVLEWYSSEQISFLGPGTRNK
jgi:hypothetical protein